MNAPVHTYEYHQFLKPEIPDEYPNIAIEMSQKTKELWSQFVGFHEVVVYKEPRKIFPTASFSVHGLKPDAVYATKIVFDVLHPNFFTYNKTAEKWTITHSPNYCMQSESVTIYELGDHFQRNDIDFGALNITSSRRKADDKTEEGQMIVCLTSRTLYQIRIVLYEVKNDELNYLKEVKFDEMIFITCSAYCGKANRDLKKRLNRFVTKRSREKCSNEPAAKRCAMDSDFLKLKVNGEYNHHSVQKHFNQFVMDSKSIATSLLSHFDSYHYRSPDYYISVNDSSNINSSKFQFSDIPTMYPTSPTQKHSQYVALQELYPMNSPYDSCFTSYEQF